jgi:hypothetical protein
MADDADWRGKPRVCPHSLVVASGGECGDERGWAEIFEQRRDEWNDQ